MVIECGTPHSHNQYIHINTVRLMTLITEDYTDSCLHMPNLRIFEQKVRQRNSHFPINAILKLNDLPSSFYSFVITDSIWTLHSEFLLVFSCSAVERRFTTAKILELVY